jgi:centrosomal protein CEP104
LFTFVPQGVQATNSQLPLNQIAFTKLGYLTLDNNERSGFQARELKSVHVNMQCALVKLIVHQNHANKFNVFNQAGLVALNCIGYP